MEEVLKLASLLLLEEVEYEIVIGEDNISIEIK
jgi:hypothetical protein